MVLVRQVIEVLLHITTAKIHCALVLLVKSRCVSTCSGNICVGRTSASSRLDLQAASGRTQITLRNIGNTTDASTFVAAEEMTATNADLILALGTQFVSSQT